MWTNYDRLHPERLDAVRTKEQALSYIHRMFEEYQIQENLFYNPLVHDPEQVLEGSRREEEDDLFVLVHSISSLLCATMMLSQC